jgi:hypothetical protein
MDKEPNDNWRTAGIIVIMAIILFVGLKAMSQN